MRRGALVLAVLGAALISPKALAVTTYSTSPFRTLIAEATVPDRNDAQLYFSVHSGIVPPREKDEVALDDGIYYQSTGQARIRIGGERFILGPGEGMFMPAGTRFVVDADGSGAPSAYLQFLLSSYPAVGSDRPAVGAVEVYRSPSPIPGLTSAPVRWLMVPLILSVLLSVFRVARTIWVLEHIISLLTKPVPPERGS
jgi:hypothetical protein